LNAQLYGNIQKFSLCYAYFLFLSPSPTLPIRCLFSKVGI